jgi:hypothetical protein
MLRVVFLKLGDYEYPLVNSLYVAEVIEQIEDMNSVASLSTMLEAMMYAGCKYLNVVGSPNRNLRREDGRIVPLTKEEISILVGIDEESVKYISDKIQECFAISKQKQVSAKQKVKKKKKNH